MTLQRSEDIQYEKDMATALAMSLTTSEEKGETKTGCDSIHGKTTGETKTGCEANTSSSVDPKVDPGLFALRRLPPPPTDRISPYTSEEVKTKSEKCNKSNGLTERFLDLNGQRLYDKDLQLCKIKLKTNLIKLSLHDNHLRDISSISVLINLEELRLHNNEIILIDSVGALKKLKILTLSNNLITNIEPLSACSCLRRLTLVNNRIADVRPLSACVQLNTLYLSQNRIKHIEPLCVLVNLKIFDIHGNPITASNEQMLKLPKVLYNSVVEVICNKRHLPVQHREREEMVVDEKKMKIIMEISGTDINTARAALVASYNNADRAMQYIFEPSTMPLQITVIKEDDPDSDSEDSALATALAMPLNEEERGWYGETKGGK